MTLFSSQNPVTEVQIWQGTAADAKGVKAAIQSAEEAFPLWSTTPLEKRIETLHRYQEALKKNQESLIKAISQETGKPLWESRTELAAMIGKVPISIEAYKIRCAEMLREQNQALSYTRHKPHGVVAVLGPFNFPGHLPNGHIVPALLAGNTVVFKPSEFTPYVGELMAAVWQAAKIPQGVFNLIQGGAETGALLVQNSTLAGVFFTGSWETGKKLRELVHPTKILALEMGGNNPLVVTQVNDIKAAVIATIQSAYLTAGQRCSCARRLIVPRGNVGESFIRALQEFIPQIKVGAYTEIPEPYMGSLINAQAASKVLQAAENLRASGGRYLVEMRPLNKAKTLLTPGLMDVTSVKQQPDEEIFGPFLQLIRVADFEAALKEANRTAYGLTAGLISDDPKEYALFYQRIHAGIINWNTPLTGASSAAPFGGVGQSGNFRPSAYYAADYCSYPVASMECAELKTPALLPPGI